MTSGEPDPITFNASPAPTVGIEVELALVDRETGALVSRAEEVLALLGEGHPGGEHPKAKHELFQCTIEAITGICTTIAEAGDDLRVTIAGIDAVAGAHGADLISVATHPFSHWQDQRVSHDPRYAAFVERLGWPVRRLAIHGTHVHVGVCSGEAAVAITHALTEYLPLLLALSASSPFWVGNDTELASVRTKVFEVLPTAGLPPRLDSWADFEAFMHTLLRAEAITSIREVWWDVRPHPDFGTVELRMCDAMATLDEVLAVAALAQCLVVDLQRRFEAGEVLDTPREWVVKENKWLACRFGLDASLLVGNEGDRQPARQILDELVERLTPLAVELRCVGELTSAVAIAERGTGHERQRAVVAGGGSTRDVVSELVKEFRGEGGYL